MPAALSLHRRDSPSPQPSPSRPLVLRAHTGEAVDLDVDRWHAPATAEEHALLAGLEGPVIDLGCGPGRLVVALAGRGVTALGVDSSPVAVDLARRRGAQVLQRDVFESIPGEGRWATALLFDGTVGMGGDPVRLLSRCRRLLSPSGRVVAEVGAPGLGWRRLVTWFERDGRPKGPSFAWAIVGADAIAKLAHQAGLELAGMTQTVSGRWFATLHASAT